MKKHPVCSKEARCRDTSKVYPPDNPPYVLYCYIVLYIVIYCSILIYSVIYCYILLYIVIYCYIVLYCVINVCSGVMKKL